VCLLPLPAAASPCAKPCCLQYRLSLLTSSSIRRARMTAVHHCCCCCCRAFCVEKNSAAPDVQFVGGEGLTATLIVPYVEFVLTEVLKNAMQVRCTQTLVCDACNKCVTCHSYLNLQQRGQSSSSCYQSSHGINAIDPAPHWSGRKREHCSRMFASITHIPSLHKIPSNMH
jgi:hypothetical protein